MEKARLIVSLGSTLTLGSSHLTQYPGLQNESQSCVTDESQHECFSLTSYGGCCCKTKVPGDSNQTTSPPEVYDAAERLLRGYRRFKAEDLENCPPGEASSPSDLDRFYGSTGSFGSDRSLSSDTSLSSPCDILPTPAKGSFNLDKWFRVAWDSLRTDPSEIEPLKLEYKSRCPSEFRIPVASRKRIIKIATPKRCDTISFENEAKQQALILCGSENRRTVEIINSNAPFIVDIANSAGGRDINLRNTKEVIVIRIAASTCDRLLTITSSLSSSGEIKKQLYRIPPNVSSCVTTEGEIQHCTIKLCNALRKLKKFTDAPKAPDRIKISTIGCV